MRISLMQSASRRIGSMSCKNGAADCRRAYDVSNRPPGWRGHSHRRENAMTDDGRELSVVDWVIDHPESQAVLRTYRVDDCCAGKSLEYACREAGVDVDQVLAAIQQAIAKGDAPR